MQHKQAWNKQTTSAAHHKGETGSGAKNKLETTKMDNQPDGRNKLCRSADIVNNTEEWLQHKTLNNMCWSLQNMPMLWKSTTHRPSVQKAGVCDVVPDEAGAQFKVRGI